MNKDFILEELKKIKDVLNMDKDEFIKNYPQNAVCADIPSAIYASKCGIVRAMTEILIERIEKNELR
ncbi:MAG: hypothetical protein ACLRT4_18245 [Thomasclavelia sp.]